MSKKQVMAEIIRHTSLSDGIFDMTLKAEEIAKEAKAGQFISVYLNNKSKILPRPVSYTHLDVYKRQDACSACDTSGINRPNTNKYKCRKCYNCCRQKS